MVLLCYCGVVLWCYVVLCSIRPSLTLEIGGGRTQPSCKRLHLRSDFPQPHRERGFGLGGEERRGEKRPGVQGDCGKFGGCEGFNFGEEGSARQAGETESVVIEETRSGGGGGGGGEGGGVLSVPGGEQGIGGDNKGWGDKVVRIR